LSDAGAFYRSVVRELIAPGLRSLGLCGSGTTFTLPDESMWLLVGFQSHRNLTGSDIPNFTINLTRAEKAAWERMREDRPWYPPVPPAGAMVPAESIRIGHLIPVDNHHSDRWWLIDDGRRARIRDHPVAGPLMLAEFGSPKPPTQVAAEVIAAVRDHGIPWLRAERHVTLRDAD
jgi:hypothetical protein